MTIRRLAALAGILVVLAAGPAGAAGGVRIESVETEDYPRISVIVSLSAETLTQTPRASDFAILVDGRRPPIDVYALSGEPMDVVIAIDTSGSMRGSAMAQARAAAISFVEQMPSTVRVGVVSFSTSPEVIAPLGSPTDEVLDGLRSLEAAGQTALYDAVVTSAALFDDSEVRRVLVLLSDGGDTSSEASLDEAAAALEAAGAELRAVALITPDTDIEALERLAPGEAVLTVEDASGLVSAYSALAQEITGQFRLSFSTSASGPTRVDVYVNTPDGIVSDSQVVPFPTSSVTAGTTPATGPALPGFVAPAPAVGPSPGLFGGGWGLPLGVALVFLGLGAGFWFVGRGGEEEGEVILPLDGLGVDAEEVAPGNGLKSRLGGGLRRLTDRVGQGKVVRAGGLDLKLDRSGLALRPGEFVILSATGVVVAVLTGLVLAGGVGAVLFGAAAAVAPRFVLQILTSRRRDKFAEQLEGTLQIIAGSMRAGHALVQALAIVASESDSPTSDEFNRVLVERRLGRPIEESLAAMARRMENEDLGWVVEAIEIQHKVGGNLVEVLDAVMTTIRDRNQLRRQVKALSAEGRMSAIVLLALPFVVAAVLGAVNPEYFAELTGRPIGRVLIGVALVFMGFGALWIKKIVEVKF